MNGALSTLKPLWIWFLVPLIVIAELVMQWRIPRQDPSDADWNAAVRAVKEIHAPGDLLVIAPDWAVQGRMYFRDFMRFKDFGRFDTTTYKRLIEVGISGAKSPESDGRTPEHTATFGRITVSRYRLPEPADVLYDFTENWREGDYDKSIKEGPKLIIDHWFHPRRVLQVSLRSRASITFKDVPLNGVLRGYAVIGYREGRFNKGRPIRLTIRLNGKPVGEREVANFSPVTPFEYALPGDGRGTITFEVMAKDNKKREFGIAVDVRRKGGPS